MSRKNRQLSMQMLPNVESDDVSVVVDDCCFADANENGFRFSLTRVM